MTPLQQQLKESIQELEQIRKVREYIIQLQIRLSSEDNALMLMEQALAKEQRDVDAIEREGLSTMFHKFLGDREEKLDKEREEYLKASLQFNELFKSVQLMRFELDLLSKKEQNIESVERKIASLIAFREEELMQLDPKTAQILKSINEQEDKLHKYGAEIEEAYDAGAKALELVRSAEQFLINARFMGQQDMWGRKHQRTGHLKKESIDQAVNMAYQSKQALIRFGNELQDVYKDLELQVNMDIEEFGNFMNVLFENLITDYLVQQKITKSLVNVTGTRQKVDAIMQRLVEERGSIKDEEERLEEERKKVVVTS